MAKPAKQTARKKSALTKKPAGDGARASAANALTPRIAKPKTAAPSARPALKQPAVKRKRRKAKPIPVRAYRPGPPLLDTGALEAALVALRALDPEAIGTMIDAAGTPPLRANDAGLEGLFKIIVSQQVSVASANAIFSRVKAGFPDLAAADILAATEAELRACGLSAPKMKTFRAIAAAVVSGHLDFAAIAAMPAEEAHDRLVTISGIGPWTADIFLLFCLGHGDAWPAGDLALQEAARLVLKRKSRPDTAAMHRIAERWRPHRGTAARLLWAYYAVMKKAGSGIALAQG